MFGNSSPDLLSDKQKFLQYYKPLPDYELARIALSDELVPDAREAINEELQARRITDLSEFKKRMQEDAEWVAQSKVEAAARQHESNWAIREWLLVMAAWLMAIALPISLILDYRRPDGRALCLLVVLLGGSFRFGWLSRRRGNRVAFHLKATVPLVLAALSTILGLLLRFAG